MARLVGAIDVTVVVVVGKVAAAALEAGARTGIVRTTKTQSSRYYSAGSAVAEYFKVSAKAAWRGHWVLAQYIRGAEQAKTIAQR